MLIYCYLLINTKVHYRTDILFKQTMLFIYPTYLPTKQTYQPVALIFFFYFVNLYIYSWVALLLMAAELVWLLVYLYYSARATTCPTI